MKSTLFIVFLIVLVSPLIAVAQYKDYVRKETKSTLFELSFDNNNVSIRTKTASDSVAVTVIHDDVKVSDTEVRFSDVVYFSASGLIVKGTVISFDRISNTQITAQDGMTTVSFIEISSSSVNLKRMNEGNIISFSDPIVIDSGQFVRGLVFSVKGHVAVYGEINRDIIALFGDIKLVTGASARGNIISINGKIDVEEKATVYGEIYSGIKEYDSRPFKFYYENEFAAGVMLNYDRVDGLALGATASYIDGDSSLPSIFVGVGYALESKRPRHYFRAVQSISRKRAISLGGEYYRKLASEDDWLLSNPENAVFVFLATEDFKDYYETEGVSGWLEFQPQTRLKFKTGYRCDNTRWLDAKTHLWSMFGGTKLFRENFSSVGLSYRTAGEAELDSSNFGMILLQAKFDSRDFEIDFNASGWSLAGNLEWSNEGLGSDFDYHRYTLTAIRYQQITNISGIRIRGQLANSDGYLPMAKRFFVGGFGTLLGYRHKEFIGTRYWMTNTEFWVSIPKFLSSALIVRWDAAQIANDTKLDKNAEVHNDLGFGIRITGIRLDVSKRLDGAGDRDPRIYVRFSRNF